MSDLDRALNSMTKGYENTKTHFTRIIKINKDIQETICGPKNYTAVLE